MRDSYTIGQYKISEQTVKKYLFILSIFILPTICFFVFYVYLNIDNFCIAFQSIDAVTAERTFVGFDNFVQVFKDLSTDGQVGISIKNSLKLWWINFIISNPLYLIFSYYIHKKFAGNKFFKIIVMAPSVVSGFVYTLVYKSFVERALPDIMWEWGYHNFPQLIGDDRYAYGNLVFYGIWLSFGTSILVYTNVMNGIDSGIIESSHIDGVNDRQEFFSIVFPIIFPTFVTMCVTGAAGMFTASGHLMAFYMTSAPPKIWGFQYYINVAIKEGAATGSYTHFPIVSAAGLLVTIPTMIVVFTIRWLLNKFDKTEDFA